jgi:hypothetical protein
VSRFKMESLCILRIAGYCEKLYFSIFVFLKASMVVYNIPMFVGTTSESLGLVNLSPIRGYNPCGDNSTESCWIFIDM